MGREVFRQLMKFYSGYQICPKIRSLIKMKNSKLPMYGTWASDDPLKSEEVSKRDGGTYRTYITDYFWSTRTNALFSSISYACTWYCKLMIAVSIRNYICEPEQRFFLFVLSLDAQPRNVICGVQNVVIIPSYVFMLKKL